MKTNKILQLSLVLMISAGISITACKKKDKTIDDKQTTTETGQSSQDNRDVQSENDNAINDMNSVISDHSNMSGGRTMSNTGIAAITGTICGLSVDTTGISNGLVTLNYNGITCNNRTRSGAIRLSIVDYAGGKRWKQAGCSLRVEYIGYKVVRASDQKSVLLNGVQYITNESGNTWWELLIIKTQSSLVYSVTGTNLSVTFEDGKTAVYNINRRITYTFPGNVLTCKGEGIGSSGGINNLENYGTTRDGQAFTSQVTTPLVWNLTCGWWAPIQGNVIIQVANENFMLAGTFGVNAAGTPVTVGSNACPYGWKLSWTVNGQSNNKVFAYL